MGKQILRAAVVAYLGCLAAVVWRADVKYGTEPAAGAAIIGLVLLVVFWRLWRGIVYVLFGGRLPITAIGQNAQFQPPSSTKAPPRP